MPGASRSEARRIQPDPEIVKLFAHPTLTLMAIAALAGTLGTRPAAADALLMVEADSGKVLHAEHATYPWYPASVTKLMTAYVTLRAIKERRVALDTLLRVSGNAAAQAPSKMGFAVGTTVTLDNALKMLMVKSANDMAVVLAEGVSGSIEKFADEMNRASQRLGMTQSSWVNPNGLPADEQITSARDMAILARAVLREFPEYEMYWRIPAIRFGRRLMRNTNGLIGHYPGADGMKTGFICASGFNVVASATRNGKRLIVVVMGAPSGRVRSEKAAQLFEKGFLGSGLTWLLPSLGTVDALQPIAAAPPNLREEMCGRNRRRPASEEDAEELVVSNDPDPSSAFALLTHGLRAAAPNKHVSLLVDLPPSMPPIVVFTGPPRKPGDPAVAARPQNKRNARTTVTVPVATQAAEPAATPAAATANASATGFTYTPQQTSTFTPAAATQPVAAPAAEPKPQAAPKPAASKAAAKPRTRAARKAPSGKPPAKTETKKDTSGDTKTAAKNGSKNAARK
jgi:D-alanyl-D-alanine carboxypeptidase